MSKKLTAVSIEDINLALQDLFNRELLPKLEEAEIELGELYALQDTEEGREKVRRQWERIQEFGRLVEKALGVGSGAVLSAQQARFQLHQLIGAMERVDFSDPLVAAFMLRVHDVAAKVG